jgi:hypothetical protein
VGPNSRDIEARSILTFRDDWGSDAQFAMGFALERDMLPF